MRVPGVAEESRKARTAPSLRKTADGLYDPGGGDLWRDRVEAGSPGNAPPGFVHARELAVLEHARPGSRFSQLRRLSLRQGARSSRWPAKRVSFICWMQPILAAAHPTMPLLCINHPSSPTMLPKARIPARESGEPSPPLKTADGKRFLYVPIWGPPSKHAPKFKRERRSGAQWQHPGPSRLSPRATK